MFQIIHKFYKKSSSELVQDILKYYELKHFALINYVYGAILVNNDLLGKGAIKKGINMKDLLLESDFLLPDGAAIRTLYSIGIACKKREGPNLHNLNGTDFMPFFLDYLSQNNYNVNIITLTVYDKKHNNPRGVLKNGVKEYIHKKRPNFRQHNEEIEYSDSNYKDFEWKEIETFLQESLKNKKHSINILLNFRGGGGRWLPIKNYSPTSIKTNLKILNYSVWIKELQ
jgi:hypothetical protein